MSGVQSSPLQPTQTAAKGGLGWELSSTMGLGIGGSVALFCILGGVQLLAREQGPTPIAQIAPGSAVTAVLLLLVMRWGVRTASRAFGQLPSATLEIPAQAQSRIYSACLMAWPSAFLAPVSAAELWWRRALLRCAPRTACWRPSCGGSVVG